MKLHLSVILCSRNPRPRYLHRVLSAIKDQTILKSSFEVILVDNGGIPELGDELRANLPQFRIIKEPRAGLTYARFAGCREANTDLLVYVDDDNILAPDYLETVKNISLEFPKMGVWSGRLLPEFEVTVPRWAKDRIGYLGLRDFKYRTISTKFESNSTSPVGAGMAVRRSIMQTYEKTCRRSPIHLLLGRAPTEPQGPLMCAEDFDLCVEATTMGFHLGLFPELSLTHLMPPERLEKDYFARLLEGYWASYCLLHLIRWPDRKMGPQLTLPKRAMDTIRSWLMSPTSRRFQRSYRDGWERGRKMYREAIASSRSPSSPRRMKAGSQ